MARRAHRAAGLAAAARAVAALFLAAVAGCTAPAPLPRSPERGPDAFVFRYRAPAARAVQLAGSWQGNTFLRGREWERDIRTGLMQDADRDGVWELEVRLGPGRYEYAFLVDGTFWEADPANPERIPDGRGGTRSLLIVP